MIFPEQNGTQSRCPAREAAGPRGLSVIEYSRGKGALLGFMLLIAGNSLWFSRTSVAGLQTVEVEWFSRIFIPLLTLFLHLLLLRLLPVRVYWAVATLDFLASLSIAAYHNYFHENLDIHIVISNISEGMRIAPFVFQYIPKPFLIVGTSVLLLQCSLARLVRSRLSGGFLGGLGGVVILLFAFAVYKVPLRSAARITDYALAIKLHGYYTALLADLFYGGQPLRKKLCSPSSRAGSKLFP
jgi:hypothetical protein